MVSLLLTAALQFLRSKFGRYSALSSLAILSAWLYAIDGSHGNNKRVFTKGLYILNQAIEATSLQALNESKLVLPLPVGLINMRNTCYMNAILQSLYSVKPYSQLIMNGSFPFHPNSIGSELQNLFWQMQNASEKEIKLPIIPRALAAKLRIDISQQEDAEELMLKLINEVDESLISHQKGNKKASKTTQNILTKYNIKPSASLQMELEQTITCKNLQHISSTKLLTNFDLSVDIQGMKTLEDAIFHHFQPELLTGDNQYRCATHGLQDAEKALRITKFPRVLAVHLKRFSFEPITYTMKKVIDPMDIPVELNMRQFAAQPPLQTSSNNTSSSTKQVPPVLYDPTAGIYDLTAIVVHEGSLETGHYYTFVKVPLQYAEHHTCSSDRFIWVKCNDQQVTPVSREEDVLQVARGLRKSRTTNTIFQKLLDNDTSTNAYLLFYTQRD